MGHLYDVGRPGDQTRTARACRLQGYLAWRVFLAHMGPDMARVLVSQTTLYFAYGLLDLFALSFLGPGAQPPQIDWGGMLENANQGVFQSPILSSPKEPYTRRLLAAVPENIGTELPTGSP
jgi:hypothetical protein